MGAEIQRDLGRLEARADSTDERLERIEKKLDQLVEYVAASKGGWKLLISVGGIAATFAAAVAEGLHWIWSPK